MKQTSMWALVVAGAVAAFGVLGCNGTIMGTTDDAGRARTDSGSARTDSGSPSTDDSSVGDLDGGDVVADTGVETPDSGSSLDDAGTVDTDAGTVDTDAGTIEVDAGTPMTDAGQRDSGISTMDAGTDSGPMTTDAGPRDSGVSMMDAGRDSGPTMTDGGTDGGRPADAGDPPVIGAAPVGYSLVWSDDFNGSTLDSTKWNTLNNSNYGSGNNEDECYFTRNVTVSGGHLVLTARRETVTCGGANPDGSGSTYYFTSGVVTSRAQGGPLRFKFLHGYAEASILMPKGNPYWSGFWLVGPGDGSTPGWPDYGEIDISEVIGGRPDITNGTFHWACSGRSSCQTSGTMYNLLTSNPDWASSNQGTVLSPSNFSTFNGVTSSRFVRYGVLWEGNRLTWYADGVPFRYFDGTQIVRIMPNGSRVVEKTVGVDIYQSNPASYPFSTVMNYEHSFILNLSVGGDFAQYEGYTGNETASGYNDGNLAANFPGEMQVDYVRVYQLP